jgi:nicotinamidase-related amidase
MLMKAQDSLLLIVDVQERLLPTIADARLVAQRCDILMRGAARLGLPVLVSEQYPKGIGPTIPELRALAAEGAVMEKLHFSCGEDDAMVGRIAACGRRQLVLAGIEAHVCVLQSALRFQERGYQVFVAADACSSRDPANARRAFRRMAANGVEVVSTEMVLFEWLHRAGTPEFKDVIQLIK